jgi:hypothetical protein
VNTLSRRSLGDWFDWEFIDVTGAGKPLTKESGYVSQGQTDFGNCTMREEAVWDGYQLVGCKSIDTGAVRYLGDYKPSNSGGGSTSVSAPSEKPKASGGGHVAPTPALPPTPVEPPSMMSGISPTMIFAGLLGLGALGAVAWKIKNKGGFSRNSHEEDCY